MTFEQWMKAVDVELEKQCGLSHYDLADKPWRDWFDDEITPDEAAEITLDEEGFYDFER